MREDAPEPLDFLPIHCQQTVFHSDLIDLVNETCDLIVLGGGGMIFHRPEDSSRSGWQFNIGIEDLKRIKVPVATYGIGYNAFHFDEMKLLPNAMEHLRETQAKTSLFSVRNQGSKDALVAGGLDGDRIEIIPDPGMFVQPHAFTLPGSADADIRIGLNWAGDRPHFRFQEPWSENRQKLINALCNAFETMARTYPGMRVYFIPHLVDRIDSDVWEMFKSRLGERTINLEDSASHIYPPSFAQVGFLADAYSQMDLTIGMRGHANIVPFGMNTVPVGLGSHDKVGFFLKEAGLEQNWLSTQNEADAGGGDRIAEKLISLLGQKDVQKVAMAKCLAEFRETTRDFNKRLFELAG
ncbi:MAG: polysaccharide pyruvyl transferase family protein [Roseibium sp.]|uniref:polysaccharide pyruvyl transferase family protein n=1 Tax=Roseibium sp. TaxID=1936156 RepID=UPI002605CE7D|nr:polysaccharide pyruvyl transferase family protein [Roseibium sp.]MCV0427912.1 polysaccharide pyruvyl transferase family protein [Roseibium sp.]